MMKTIPKETPAEAKLREEREQAHQALMDTREEFLQICESISPDLKKAVEKDYYNKGQNVPETIKELVFSFGTLSSLIDSVIKAPAKKPATKKGK